MRYTLTPELPVGLKYTEPGDSASSDGVIAGTPTEGQPPTSYRLPAGTLDGRRVEPTETLTVLADPLIKIAKATGDRRRRHGTGTAAESGGGVGGRGADTGDGCRDRFTRQLTTKQVTVGGQALDLNRDAQTGCWHQAAGVAWCGN